MIFTTEIDVNVPADQAWAFLTEEFGTIGNWLSVLRSSRSDAPLAIGTERLCVLPNGKVSSEELITFSPQEKQYTYRATSGIPAFVRGATNTWTVTHLKPEQSRITSSAKIALAWWAVPITPMFYLGLKFTLGRVKHELQYAIEQGAPHPRVLRQQAKYLAKSAVNTPNNA